VIEQFGGAICAGARHRVNERATGQLLGGFPHQVVKRWIEPSQNMLLSAGWGNGDNQVIADNRPNEGRSNASRS
jgi:hypothetical protein